MKLDQIAYYAHNEDQVEDLQKMLGLEKEPWVEDNVFGEVDVYDSKHHSWIKTTSRAKLLFNYTHGIEIEILTYTAGPHWHMRKREFIDGTPFLSHLGFHMQEGEVSPNHEVNLVQRMRTLSHTNEKIKDTRRYNYEIYSTTPGKVLEDRKTLPNLLPIVNTDLKYIWRIEA
jgi:hypothetical protein